MSAKQMCSKGAHRKHCLNTVGPPVLLRRCAKQEAHRETIEAADREAIKMLCRKLTGKL